MIGRAARRSDGFGLVVFVIALVILNFVILALFASAASGAVASATETAERATDCPDTSTRCGR